MGRHWPIPRMVRALREQDDVVFTYMRLGLPRLLVLSLASLCVAGLVLADIAAAAPTTAQKIERAARVGDISSEQKLIYGLRSYGNPDKVPTALRGEPNRISKELSVLLLEAVRARPRMTAAQRREVDSYLARPSNVVGDGTGWCDNWTLYNQDSYLTPDGKFKIHWVTTKISDGTQSVDAPDLGATGSNSVPEYIDGPTGVAAALQTTYNAEVSNLSWAPPPGDGATGGGSDLSDVYLCELQINGVYGYVAPETASGRTATSYMVVDNDFVGFPSSPEDSLKVTAAHEYNHMLQYGYDFLQDIWMFESTATWMEDKVYDSIDDYLYYLPPWAARPHMPLTKADGAREYGSAVWNHWLDDVEGFGPSVVRRAWEYSDTVANTVAGGGFAPAAYSDAINDPDFGGSSASFADSFGRFAIAAAEWNQGTPPLFPEGAAYPDLARAGSLSTGTSTALTIDHAAFKLIDIPVPSSGAIRLRASSTTAATTRPIAALVGLLPTGNAVGPTSPLPNGGTATLTLPDASQYVRITAVLVNRGSSQSGYNSDPDAYVADWIWSNDAMPFNITVDSGNFPPSANFTLNSEAVVGMPLTFTAASTDPNTGDGLTHTWDLDNDGQFDDASGSTTLHTYLLVGQQTARLRTVDEFGATGEYSLVFPVRSKALADDPSGTDQPPVVRANLARLPRVKKGRMRLRFSASEAVRLTGVIKYGRRQIAKASAKGDATKKSVISFKIKKKYWKLLRKRKKLKVTVTLTALDSTNQKFSDKRKTVLRKG